MLKSFFIDSIKLCPTEHDFSAYFHAFYTFEGFDIFGDILDLESGQCHIFTLYPTPTRDSLFEFSVFIDDSQTESVIFGLDIV